MNEFAIRGWAGIGLHDTLPHVWHAFRHFTTLQQKRYHVESYIFPLFQQTRDFDSPALLHDILRNTIANVKFSAAIDITSRGYLGLTPLAFAHLSQIPQHGTRNRPARPHRLSYHERS
jgi:hypothetical protein